MAKALDGRVLKSYHRRLRLSQEALEIFARIRSSQPARRVRASGGNVPVWYPSPKMEWIIQAESHTVEFARLLELERDHKVFEYYDQPPTFELAYLDRGGRQRTSPHTADYFVFREGSAGWEECKPLSKLQELAQTKSTRYVFDTEQGKWRCPAGEAYAAKYGLTYDVWVAEEINWTIQENWLYLEEYYQDLKQLSVPEQALTLLHQLVDETPGIHLGDLRKVLEQAHFDRSLVPLPSGHAADLINIALAWGLLYVDQATYRLSDQNIRQVPVYRDQRTALAAPEQAREEDDLCPEANPVELVTEAPVQFDGKTWHIKLVGNTEIILMGEQDETTTFPTKIFEKLVREGKITGTQYRKRSNLSTEGSERLELAGPEALAVAVTRDHLLHPEAYPVQEYTQALATCSPSGRTKRRWKLQFREAEATDGSGFVGLLPKYQKCGRPPIASEDLALVEQAITTKFDTVTQAPGRGAYGEYLLLAEANNRKSIPQSTFYGYLQKHKDKYEQVLVREGERAAYPFKDYHRPKERQRNYNGQSAWQESDIDHKLIDLILVDTESSETDKPIVLGTCWMTALVLRQSRRMPAYVFSFDPPSYRSCMMVLRLCVKRYGRLPASTTIDGGPEFHSTYFETFLARYRIRKQQRPAHEPRYGTLQERLGLTLDIEFVDHLLGNTQANRKPRTKTKKTDPNNLAVWTLPEFAKQVRKWEETVYDVSEHPGLNGLSPRQAYERSMEQDGARQHKLIPYDEAFLMMTFPTTRTGKAKIQAGSGVRINYIDYWCEAMRPHIGKIVPVRYDPFNRQVAYAFINKRWRKCLSTIHEFEGCTEKEMQLIAEGVRQREKTLHKRERVEIKQKALAKLRREADAKQKELLQAQRRKDRETKRTYAILEGSDGASATAEHPLPPERPASQHPKTSGGEPKQAKTTAGKAPAQEKSLQTRIISKRFGDCVYEPAGRGGPRSATSKAARADQGQWATMVSSGLVAARKSSAPVVLRKRLHPISCPHGTGEHGSAGASLPTRE